MRAEAKLIDLPDKAGVFDTSLAEPRLQDWKEWMLRSPEELAGVDPEGVRAHADPGLRGRLAGAGVGLETLTARMVRLSDTD